jgi:hypothetical protein
LDLKQFAENLHYQALKRVIKNENRNAALKRPLHPKPQFFSKL